MLKSRHTYIGMTMAALLQVTQDGEARFPLFRNITRIGADARCDVHLASVDIADDHAHILRERDDFIVASIGRGRQIFVNGKKEKRRKLSDGDVLRIGDAELQFVLCDDNPVGPSADTNGYRQIVSFSEKLLRKNSLADLLPTLMDSVVDLTRADKGFLVLFEDGTPVVKVACNVAGEDLGNAVAELSDSILSKVVREQQPLIINDAQDDKEFKSSASVMNLKLQSVMCVPLTEGGEVFGLIYLGSNQVANLFEPGMLEMVTIFAGHASLLIRNAQLLAVLRQDNESLREAAGQKNFGEIVGSSEAMQEVFKTIRKVAPTDISVLITGETGTGKELIAAELHRRSPRLGKPFVVVNCGAIPENLLESELFGHVRGAFTGAVATRKGHFQIAHGGTLFLDEIGEMPPSLQVKLLRALQERVVTKVGANKQESVDIRVLAATNRDLEADIQAGSFREDLYYRLNVVSIHLPPLRDRANDVMLLARYLLKRETKAQSSKVKGFSPQAAMMIKRCPWPGNIRQLENHIKKAVVMSDRMQLSAEDLELADQKLTPVMPLTQAKEDFQRRYINEILLRNNGNRTQTARDLAVDPRTIFRHLEREGDTETEQD